MVVVVVIERARREAQWLEVRAVRLAGSEFLGDLDGADEGF